MLLGLYRNEFIADLWKISFHLKIKFLGLKGKLFPTKDRPFANKAGLPGAVMARPTYSPCYNIWDAKPGNLSLGVWLQVSFLPTYYTYIHTYILACVHTCTIHIHTYIIFTMYS